MFFTLRKIIIGSFWGLILCGLGYLYLRREIFQPLVELIEVGREIEFKPQPRTPAGEFVGEVTQVTGPDTFRIKPPTGPLYHFRLEGVEVPQPWELKYKSQRVFWEESKTNLALLLLSNQVRIEVSYTNATRGGMGVVFLTDTNRGTNLNLTLVQSGHAKLNRDYVRTRPVKEQYAFLVAQQRAQEKKLGIWL